MKDVMLDAKQVWVDLDPPCERQKRIVETKQARVDLDAVLQRLKETQGVTSDLAEMEAICYAKIRLVESIMWLGMRLKALAAPNPYPNSYNPSNTVVEPTADGLKL